MIFYDSTNYVVCLEYLIEYVHYQERLPLVYILAGITI